MTSVHFFEAAGTPGRLLTFSCSYNEVRASAERSLRPGRFVGRPPWEIFGARTRAHPERGGIPCHSSGGPGAVLVDPWPATVVSTLPPDASIPATWAVRQSALCAHLGCAEAEWAPQSDREPFRWPSGSAPLLPSSLGRRSFRPTTQPSPTMTCRYLSGRPHAWRGPSRPTI
jgi:hypothetical protein